jgi:2-C-methyl-D-erythritol 2,4-cyclodiphosphate synthase
MAELPDPFRLRVPDGIEPLPFRIGHGYDLHRLKQGGRLVLAGVLVSEEVGPIAHSDGDVVVHAIVDALLGAMGWGDIGQHFPDSDARWKGAASTVFLNTVFNEISRFDYFLVNLDVTITAESPRIGPFREQMIRHLANVLGGTVNIKAGTNEGCDAIGRGEAIAAHAVVLLQADF